MRTTQLNGGLLGKRHGTLVVGVLQDAVVGGKTLLIDGDVSIAATSAAQRIDNFPGCRATELAMACNVDPASVPEADPDSWVAVAPLDATILACNDARDVALKMVRSLLTAETGGDVVDVLVEAMGQLGVEIEDVHDDTRADIEAALDKLGVGSLWPSL